MPTSKKKKQEMVVRREIVEELSRLGLGAAGISRALGISITQAKHASGDITDTDGPGRNGASAEAVYSRVFSFYASIASVGSESIVGLRDAIERYLDVPKIIATAEGVIAGVEARDEIETSPTLKPYRNLIDAIWGRPMLPHFTGTTLLAILCEEVTKGRIQSPTRSGMTGTLASLIVKNTAFPILHLTEFAARYIDSILKARLSPEEHIVISRRFGLLNQHVHTLAECGKFIDRSQESVRKYEAKALRKLRHLKALGKFGRLFSWGTRRDYITNLLTLAYTNRTVGVHGTSLSGFVYSRPLGDIFDEKGIYFMEQLKTMSREEVAKGSSLDPDDIKQLDTLLSRPSGVQTSDDCSWFFGTPTSFFGPAALKTKTKTDPK